jgi:hypothetical protein
MATALDIITLQQAKDWLVVDFPDNDAIITRNIQTAVAWVEKYTCYLLYSREINIPVLSSKTAIPYYPLSNIVMENAAGEEVNAMISEGSTKTYVYYAGYCGLGQNKIAATAGYASIDLIPAPLLDACYKLITYLYENRDAYSSTLPVDIQLLINQFRRSATI